MGTIQHDAVIVSSWDTRGRLPFEEVREFARGLGAESWPIREDWETLLVGPVPSVANGYETFLLLPDGSKEGWDTSHRGDLLRAIFIEKMAEVGDLVHVSWGELGTQVTTPS